MQNQALDAEPPIASFLKSMLIGGGPVNAAVPSPKVMHAICLYGAANFCEITY